MENNYSKDILDYEELLVSFSLELSNFDKLYKHYSRMELVHIYFNLHEGMAIEDMDEFLIRNNIDEFSLYYSEDEVKKVTDERVWGWNDQVFKEDENKKGLFNMINFKR